LLSVELLIVPVVNGTVELVVVTFTETGVDDPVVSGMDELVVAGSVEFAVTGTVVLV
jgi:hypothetical protein